MYDELIKKIRHCATDPMHCLSCGEVKDGRCFKRLMTQAADAIEELSKRMDESIPKSDAEIIIAEVAKPRWIPVSERLPDGRDSVLALTGDCDIYVCDYIPSVKQFWTIPGDELHIDDITHWMPLPEPPKEKT